MSAACHPTSLAELTTLLTRATSEQAPVRVGQAPYVDPSFSSGAQPDGDAQPEGRAYVQMLSLDRLAASLEHCAGDLTATVPAGMTLADTNRALAQNGQWLALDPPLAGSSSIGAIVAKNASGPRRYRHGTPRDLIIGVEMVLSDGRIAKAGGRVVKNVAGYDLARLMCGSLGSLAVITSATFKLTPIAPASRTVVLDAPSTATLISMLDALASSPMTPSAVEIDSPPHRLLVRFETTATAAEHQAHATMALGDRLSAASTMLMGADESACWSSYEDRTWRPGVTRLRIALLPSQMAEFLTVMKRLNVDYSLGGRAALGVLYLALGGGPQPQADAIATVRRTVDTLSGHFSFEAIDPTVAALTLPVANQSDALPLMQALKARFDPLNILNPGGGPAGL